jgi:hypothetical protein
MSNRSRPRSIVKHSAVNILMVDDQPAKLLSYEVILRSLGENIIKANSASEVFERGHRRSSDRRMHAEIGWVSARVNDPGAPALPKDSHHFHFRNSSHR